MSMACFKHMTSTAMSTLPVILSLEMIPSVNTSLSPVILMVQECPDLSEVMDEIEQFNVSAANTPISIFNPKLLQQYD